MVKLKLISALIFFAAAFAGQAEVLRTEIFQPTFKSLQISEPDNTMSQALIHTTNAGSVLEVSFDELAEESRYLRFRLRHCDSLWQPSQISDMEYASGFNEAEITDWQFSDNTYIPYVHYRFQLPHPDLQPLISGNYIAEVFDSDDPSETLLQVRFRVCEDLVGVTAAASTSTDVDYNGRHQQLRVDLDLDGAQIDDPYNDLRLVIVQNGREEERHVLEKPLRVGLKSAVYDHQPQLIFPAGNEYRRFTTANERYPGMGVQSIGYVDTQLQAMLRPDAPRNERRYIFERDQEGRYYPDQIDATDVATQSDYVMTYFTLETPRLPGEVYIEGDLTLRNRDAGSAMIYDETLGAYIKALNLKQGLYNYQYVTDDPGNPIEGDHYETVNEYLVLVYYRPPSARYDRLVGMTIVSTAR